MTDLLSTASPLMTKQFFSYEAVFERWFSPQISSINYFASYWITLKDVRLQTEIKMFFLWLKSVLLIVCDFTNLLNAYMTVDVRKIIH